ncbi:unnamed protein product, partial [Prorocentrum cordatum]
MPSPAGPSLSKPQEALAALEQGRHWPQEFVVSELQQIVSRYEDRGSRRAFGLEGSVPLEPGGDKGENDPVWRRLALRVAERCGAPEGSDLLAEVEAPGLAEHSDRRPRRTRARSRRTRPPRAAPRRRGRRPPAKATRASGSCSTARRPARPTGGAGGRWTRGTTTCGPRCGGRCRSAASSAGAGAPARTRPRRTRARACPEGSPRARAAAAVG